MRFDKMLKVFFRDFSLMQERVHNLFFLLCFSMGIYHNLFPLFIIKNLFIERAFFFLPEYKKLYK